MKVKRVFIATYEHGWNVKENRPATKHEQFFDAPNVCSCTYCADDPWYGSHYCKRYGDTDTRFYTDHHTRWEAT